MGNRETVAAILARSEKKWNVTAGSIENIVANVKAVSSGNMALDYILGIGGFPLGRSVELAGLPSSGKTTTALQIAANIQRIIKAGGDPELGIGPDDFILYLDYEYTIDPEYCASLGLDINDSSFILTQPDTLEDGANFAIELIETGAVRLVIWDSVAAMTPSAKAEAEIGKSLPAVQAKLMSDLGQRLNPMLAQHNTLNIWVNHLKEAIDMGGYKRPGAGPRMTTPGGVALKFFASVRVEYRQRKQNKSKRFNELLNETEEVVTSTDVNVKVTKNKVGPPFREAIVRVRFGKGFDNLYTALQFLLAHKKIMHAAGIFKFHKLESEGLAPDWMVRAASGAQAPYIKGEENLFRAADEHPEWREALIAYAANLLNGGERPDFSDTLEPEDSDEETSSGLGVDISSSELEDLLEG